MIFSRASAALFNSDPAAITTFDSHTEGEITRLVIGGVGRIPGKTMMEKLEYFKVRHDRVRLMLTREPRGSRDILAALVTEAVSPGADFGLIYMDARRYPFLCGHATIGAVATLFRMGFLSLEQGENRVIVDTPSGVMETLAHVSGDRVEWVAVDMVPSFVQAVDQVVHVGGMGEIYVDLVCTGGYFAMVDADRIGIAPVMENKDQLVDLGMKIIDAANAQLTVSHPTRPEVNTVDVTEFYISDHTGDRPQGRGVVVYGESHMDRSPCGTGTAAKMALLHHHGRIGMHQPYENFSPLGTRFEAELVAETKIGPSPAYVTRIKGRAWMTGLHHFILEETDPFKDGYLV